LVNDDRGLDRGHEPPSPDASRPPAPGPGGLRSVARFAESGAVPHESWEPEGLWSVLFEQAPLPYALYELSTRRVMGNRMCAELFGYEHVPLAWFPSATLGHPDDQGRTEALLARIGRGETDFADYDKRYVRADGSVFEGHVRASVVRDGQGQAWGVLLAIEDVTDRMAHEQALAESESRLAALVANSHDAIVVIDDKGRLTWASPSSDRLLGESAQSHIGEELIQWAHPDDRPVAVERLVMAFENPGGVTGPLRMRMLRPDGVVLPVETLATNLLDDPAVRGIVINVRDLTDTEEAASALEMTETRYRRMLENISDTVTLVGRDGRIILTTGNLRPVLGYPQEFWDGLDAFALVHPEEMEAARGTFGLLMKRPGSQYNGELRVRVPGGGFRVLEVNVVNMIDTPDVEALVITSRDVTERKEMERETTEARDQAVRALRERTEFIANVSHELRTPIHGVLGLCELLETTELDDDARTLARNISRATDSLRMVLDDILDFSKIEVGRLATTSEPINVAEMHAYLDSIFDAQATAKGIHLTAAIEPGFPENVRGDSLRIRQVLTNLISNAIKFTEQGDVTVTVARVPGSRPPMCRIAVADTGIGIPPEAHERLFEPFSQAFTNTGSDYGGTGLGLAIARRLVELMGGELSFTSEVAKGSEFFFTLPLVEAVPEPFTADDRPDPVGAGSGRRVLVVEDNAINQLLVRRQLARLGYETVVVASGHAALETFPDVAADLVLMDWQLPGIDGLETTRQIREWERANRRPRTPVVAMTASALAGDRERCLAAGMDDFIAKPVSIGILDATVRRWVGASAEAAEASPEAVLDPRALDILAEELDDPALVATVVRTFLRELPGRVEWIAAACANGDQRGLGLMTHTLRSTSMAIGARGLVTACERLEQTARDHPDGTGWDVAPLRIMAQSVADALGRAIGRPTSTAEDQAS
jgi:PAS domain S-box-containing protein